MEDIREVKKNNTILSICSKLWNKLGKIFPKKKSTNWLLGKTLIIRIYVIFLSCSTFYQQKNTFSNKINKLDKIITVKVRYITGLKVRRKL